MRTRSAAVTERTLTVGLASVTSIGRLVIHIEEARNQAHGRLVVGEKIVVDENEHVIG